MVEIVNDAPQRGPTPVDPVCASHYPLDVPLFRQEKDSNACGLYCLKMLYRYYGHDREVAEIAAALELIPTGVYAQELGYHLLQHGFGVTLVTRDTVRFPLIYGRMCAQELHAAIAARLAATPDGHKEGAFWRGLLRFRDAGGTFDLCMPTLEATIAPALQCGHPVMVCLDAKTLYQFQDLADGPVDERSYGQAGHYVILTALDDHEVTIADPSATFGGVNRYPRQRFLYAWYSFQAYTLLAEPR